MRISSNYFFNFTSNFSYLLENLNHSAFSPRYNYEDFSFIHPSLSVIRKIYILMKCFCDIPLGSLMKNHMDKYGYYGIGLKKEWGIVNNLTPVHYIPVLSENVWYQTNIASLYSLTSSQECDANTRDLIVNYIIYTKPYQKGETVYYDEKEWRYIPSIENIKKIFNGDSRIKHHLVFPNQATDNFNLESIKSESNRLKNNQFVRLPFNLDDLKYLIVKEHDERNQVKKLMNGNDGIEIFIAEEILNCKEVLEA